LAAEVCVEMRHLDGEDVEHDGERAGVGRACAARGCRSSSTSPATTARSTG
jgi:hypothetical protein